MYMWVQQSPHKLGDTEKLRTTSGWRTKHGDKFPETLEVKHHSAYKSYTGPSGGIQGQLAILQCEKQKRKHSP